MRIISNKIVQGYLIILWLKLMLEVRLRKNSRLRHTTDLCYNSFNTKIGNKFFNAIAHSAHNMAWSRTDDNTQLENTVKFIFLCLKFSIPEAMQEKKYRRREHKPLLSNACPPLHAFQEEITTHWYYLFRNGCIDHYGFSQKSS